MRKCERLCLAQSGKPRILGVNSQVCIQKWQVGGKRCLSIVGIYHLSAMKVKSTCQCRKDPRHLYSILDY